MINAITAKANVVTRSPGPTPKYPLPPPGGPYRADFAPYWEGEALAVGSVLYLTMTLRTDGTLSPLYDIIVRYPIESVDDAEEVDQMLVRQMPLAHELPDGEVEQRVRVTIRAEPSSPSGVALAKMEWVEEPGATPAQHAALHALLASQS
jgi:hypothetical protein